MDRWKFYEKNLNKFINKKSSILIIGASEREYELFKNLQYENFTLSNFNPDTTKYYYKIIHVDATKIYFNDSSFDYVITHACIHHMRKPHLAILEMYRVSKIGTLIIEGNDSWLMRLSTKLGISEDFEVSSVDKNNKLGGVEESGIPNYVYRWNERELFKTLSSYDPEIQHKISFNYENDLENSGTQNHKYKNKIYSLIKLLLKIFFIVFKKQQNLLSIYIDKKESKKRNFTDISI
jgi:ubiquinone/menaquinone biosynthesis C-methylase UbiE